MYHDRQPRPTHRRSEVGAPEDAGEKDEEVEELLSGDPARPEHGGVLAHAQVLRVHAHYQLDERGQRQQEEDGREGHVVGEVDCRALLALELDLEKRGGGCCQIQHISP